MKLNIVSSSLLMSFVGFFLVATLCSIFGIVSTPFSIAIRGYACLFFLLFFLRVAKFNFQNVKFFEVVFIIYFLMYLMRIGYDTLVIGRELSKANYVYWVWTIGACMIPGLAAMKINSIYIIRVQSLLLIILIVSSFLTMIFGDTKFYSTETSKMVDIGRLNLSSLNPIAISTLGSLTILLSILQLSIKKNKKKLKFLSIFGFMVGCYLISASGSRGPVVALLISLMFFVSNLSLLIKIFSILIGCIGMYFLYNVMIIVRDSFNMHSIDRFTNTGSEFDGSVLGRIQMIKGSFNQFLDHPLTGSALEEFITKYYPHNLLLESLMSMGIFGGVIFIYLNLYIILNSKNIMISSPNLRWIFSFHLFFFTLSFATGSVWSSTYLWVSLGAAYSCLKEFKLKVSN